jgi:hypothetical protein
MNCGNCLESKVKIVELSDGICPQCHTDYKVLADVFSVTATKPKTQRLKAHAQPIPPPGPERDLALMQYEWQGWQDIVAEFRKLGIDVDETKHDKLIAAIQLWGEKLHKLRHYQPEKTVEKALLMQEEKYAR